MKMHTLPPLARSEISSSNNSRYCYFCRRFSSRACAHTDDNKSPQFDSGKVEEEHAGKSLQQRHPGVKRKSPEDRQSLPFIQPFSDTSE